MTKQSILDAVANLVAKAVAAPDAQEAYKYSQAAGQIMSLVYSLPSDAEVPF